MKLRLTILVLLLASSLFVLVGCVKDSDIVGTWTLYYTWSGSSSPSATTWTFDADHTFTSGTGGFGIWTLNGNKIRLEYDNIYDTVYTGTVRSDGVYMSGTMTTNQPASGTWYATKGVTILAEPEKDMMTEQSCR